MMTRDDWDKDDAAVADWNNLRQTAVFNKAVGLAKEVVLSWKVLVADNTMHALTNAKREGAIEIIKFFENLHRTRKSGETLPEQFVKPKQVEG